ncbi:MAG: type I-A CRISPR-associated protein Cas5a [Nitrososphaerales archaeon]
MSLKALVVHVRASPYLSIATAESYQYRSSYLLPPPSTLIGALGRSLYHFTGKGEGYNSENLRLLKGFVKDVFVKPLSSTLRIGTLIRRLRTLELNESPEIKRPIDAMVREQLFTKDLLLIYLIDFALLPTELSHLMLSLPYSMDRLGDTESLISVMNVEMLNVLNLKDEVIVDTYVKRDLLQSFNGNYVATAFPSLWEPKKPASYLLPLISRPQQPGIYDPSTFRATPSKDALALNVSDRCVIITYR